MGLISRVLGAGEAVRGVGDAVGGVAEVFVGNRAERDAAEQQRFIAALAQYGAEFAQARQGRFDRFMDGLNRLPRPLLVIGTLGMMVHAMVAPESFARRMEGLTLVPDPLWWLLGAIVSFYFGSRELYYQRNRTDARIVLSEPGTPVDARVEATVAAAEPNGAPKADEGSAAPALGRAQEANAAAARAERSGSAAELERPGTAADAGRPGTASRSPVNGRAADPDFNAAVEEWRQTRG